MKNVPRRLLAAHSFTSGSSEACSREGLSGGVDYPFRREVVGFSVGEWMRRSLVIAALAHGLIQRAPPARADLPFGSRQPRRAQPMRLSEQIAMRPQSGQPQNVFVRFVNEDEVRFEMAIAITVPVAR